MRVACYTSASYNYLDRARVLFETVREFHPEWEIWFCLSDEEPPGFIFDPAHEGIDRVIKLRDLPIDEPLAWAFEHDIVELCTAVKGPCMELMLRDGVDKVVYLDPDIALFGRLDEVLEVLDRHSAVLTPHLVTPEVGREAIMDNEIGALKYGVYNLGFAAVSNTEAGRAFAAWWSDRLVAFCFDEPENGLFTDQKWCNHAPVFFPELAVLRHKGYNVASWNLSQRPVVIGPDGRITAGGDPLRFFHFTKVTHVGEVMLERYAGGRLDVFEVMHWYKRRLAAHTVHGLPAGWWHYGRYENGNQITKADRRSLRAARLNGRHLANPFASPVPIVELALEAAHPQPSGHRG